REQGHGLFEGLARARRAGAHPWRGAAHGRVRVPAGARAGAVAPPPSVPWGPSAGVRDPSGIGTYAVNGA
ncbi:hypothetical protein ABZY44_30380, partial [Streptomyces sp. NPDC006544]|uniref:hypothetical protein n=1 Tax=Streptomyces sp. NPDC006544 TaxID=3154583 RepID=UPI0033AF624B